MKTLFGTPASPGIVTGKAFVVSDYEEDNYQKMSTGDILVIQYSTPMFFELLLKSSGIVTEVGGITCHAASLARDLNKPCVVSVNNLMKIIKTGDTLTINGSGGEVFCEV